MISHNGSAIICMDNFKNSELMLSLPVDLALFRAFR